MSMPRRSSTIQTKDTNERELEQLDRDCLSATDEFRSDVEEEVRITKKNEGPGKTPKKTAKTTPYTKTKKTTMPKLPEEDPLRICEEIMMPLSSTTTQTGVSRYYQYICQSGFDLLSPWQVIEDCRLYARDEDDETKALWEEMYPLLKGWLTSQTAAAVRSFLDIIPKGVQSTRLMLKGVSIGIAIESQRSKTKMLEDLSLAVETSGNMLLKLQQETRSHQAQTIEFVSQITHASDTVARFQASVEQLKLDHLRTQLTTGRPRDDPIPSSSRIADAPMTISPPTLVGTPVEKISLPGTYMSSFGIVKLDNESLSSIDSTTIGLRSLQVLQGKPLSLCYIVLNKDLHIINEKANQNNRWISSIFDAPKDQRNKKMIDLMSSLPTRTFQWERRDVD